MNFIFRGIWASTIATSSMTLAMFQFFAKLRGIRQKPLPPAQLTESVERKMGLDKIPDEVHKQLAMISHYGYGAACGIAYAALASKFPGNPVLKGGLFGLAIFTASYYGLIPGLNLSPSAPQMNRQRNAMMIASHVVWGVALAYAEEKLKADSTKLLGKR